MPGFKFNISFPILNHLGRNLYRSLITVIGEAISNSWDAGANNVWIKYDPENKKMIIIDDGEGMNKTDLQDKFLNIGYAKRAELGKESNSGRPFIGRKGIGKLALLSYANKIIIFSKKNNNEITSVIIDNREIDREIKGNTEIKDLSLKEPNASKYEEVANLKKSGTIIYFEELNGERNSGFEYLKKIIALYFRFSLIDKDFNIYLNDEKITIENLSELAGKTQFVWNFNNFSDPFLDLITPRLETKNKELPQEIKGFIASVAKPKDRNIFGSGERIGVDLFVNGRLRETDILKHSPSSRIPQEYLYGQIHIDALDSGDDDPFTSSREGVVRDNEEYNKHFPKIKDVVNKIFDDWDILRAGIREDGDIDNTKNKTKKERRAEELFRETSFSFTQHKKSVEKLAPDGEYNLSSYVECFIIENLLRDHIENKNAGFKKCMNIDPTHKTCIVRNKESIVRKKESFCIYCTAKKKLKVLKQSKKESRISIKVREKEDSLLAYVDYSEMARLIGDSYFKAEDPVYKIFRNSVMHTSLLTEDAKLKLTTIRANIVARVENLDNEGDI